jgi:FkbM family methyltransferase
LRRPCLDLLPSSVRELLGAILLASRFYGSERKVNYVLSQLKGDVFIDVGAEYGHYSLMLSENFKRVFAFEPSPSITRILRKNVLRFGAKNIKVVELAVCDRTGVATFYLTSKRGYDSLIRPKNVTMSILVKTCTLSSFFRNEHKIDLIKVDVEGAEHLVLRGAESIIHKVDMWIVECHDQGRIKDIEKYFYSNGYKVKWLTNIHLWAFRQSSTD